MTPGKPCGSCGAELFWVRTPAGKPMPLDPEVVRVDPDPHGRESVVTEEGKVVRGWPATPSVPLERIVEGRRSHFATCPNASQHRRRR